MEFRLGQTQLTIRFGFVAVLTLSALLDPSGWGVLGLLAALLHELGHLFCCLALKHPPKALELTCFGPALIPREGLTSTKQELLILFSGSGVNLLCAGLCFWAGQWFFQIGVFGLFHLAFGLLNLFPAQGLDGGKALSLMLEQFCGCLWGQRLFHIIQFVFLLSFTTICLYWTIQHRLHWTGLVFCSYLWLAALLPGPGRNTK